MSMIGMGMAEILIILGILGGGGVGGLPPQPLEAPRDTVWQAVDYVLPGAHVAFHGNMEYAWNQMEGLLDEVSGLRIFKASPSAVQVLAMARSGIAQTAIMGKAEVGLDFREDLGSVTVSLRSDGPERFQVLVRARGRFGNDRLKESIAKELPETDEYKGVALHRLPERDFPGHVLCFLDETTALLGPVEHVRMFIDGGALDGAEAVGDDQGGPAHDGLLDGLLDGGRRLVIDTGGRRDDGDRRLAGLDEVSLQTEVLELVIHGRDRLWCGRRRRWCPGGRANAGPTLVRGSRASTKAADGNTGAINYFPVRSGRSDAAEKATAILSRGPRSP